MFVAFDLTHIYGLLFFKISTKILITSLLKFFKFLSFENHLMLISFFLILKLQVSLLLNFSSTSFNDVTILFWSFFLSLLLILQRVWYLSQDFRNLICNYFLSFLTNYYVIRDLNSKSFGNFVDFISKLLAKYFI